MKIGADAFRTYQKQFCHRTTQCSLSGCAAYDLVIQIFSWELGGAFQYYFVSSYAHALFCMGVTILSHIKEKRSLNMFQNRVPRKIQRCFLSLNMIWQLLRTENLRVLRYFVTAGENCIISNFMACTPHQILIKYSYPGR